MADALMYLLMGNHHCVFFFKEWWLFVFFFNRFCVGGPWIGVFRGGFGGLLLAFFLNRFCVIDVAGHVGGPWVGVLCALGGCRPLLWGVAGGAGALIWGVYSSSSRPLLMVTRYRAVLAFGGSRVVGFGFGYGRVLE